MNDVVPLCADFGPRFFWADAGLIRFGKVHCPMPKPTLTDGMLIALQQLADAGDRMLVRLYGQWWVPKSRQMPPVGLAHEDSKGRTVASGAAGEALVMIPTATVRAMLRRKLLKAVGGKRKVIAGGAARLDIWCVEITPAGTALRGELEDQAQRVYDGALARAAGR